MSFPSTRKLRENVTKSGTIQKLTLVQQLLNEANMTLREQHEVLKRRGLGLPQVVFDSLALVSTRLRVLREETEQDRFELERLRALAEVSTMLNSSLDLDTVLNQLMDSVIKLTGAERGFILLNNPNTSEIEYRISRSANSDPKDHTEISQTVVRQVIESGQPVLTDNAVDDPRLQGQKSVMTMALRSILCAPLKRKNEVKGVIYLTNSLVAGVFEEYEVRVLSMFADQAAMAIDNAQAFSRVKEELQMLRIEIDTARTDKQVGEITETEYFQGIATRAAELRKRKTP
jgi:transcriptional regulator with GAF, ATPase, and Fis domain